MSLVGVWLMYQSFFIMIWIFWSIINAFHNELQSLLRYLLVLVSRFQRFKTLIIYNCNFLCIQSIFCRFQHFIAENWEIFIQKSIYNILLQHLVCCFKKSLTGFGTSKRFWKAIIMRTFLTHDLKHVQNVHFLW